MQNFKKKKSTSNLKKFISRHKIVTTGVVIFLTCCTMNFVLIFNFIKVLENMQ